MANQGNPGHFSPTDLTDEASSSADERQTPRASTQRDSIRHYVNAVLLRHGGDEEQQPSTLNRSRIQIDTRSNRNRDYENLSAFRQYSSGTGQRANAQQRRQESGSISDENDDDDNDPPRRAAAAATPTERPSDLDETMDELNMDPNPIVEQRESREQIYKQKVYLRQLQPPTPQPIEIQVQEVLLKGEPPKPPIHVRVGQQEPRTPSPIYIKGAPPQPPPIEPDQPIVYNKYVPPPKQAPQQIIIHRYPDLPPKPRPIVIEQWLPHKPAPKRIIKHSLPREALQTPPIPHNLIVTYSKPRALIEVELVRLPVVKIDPQTYQQMSAAGQDQLTRSSPFRHEQEYLSRGNSTGASQSSNQIHWRI